MPDKLTILGSGSCNVVPGRMAASVLLQLDGKNIVYDFGRGAAIRLTEAGLRQDEVTTIILSHLHPDHVTDLLPFLHAASWSQIDQRHADLTIYGQPGTRGFMAKLLGVFSPQQLSRNFTITTTELAPGPTVIDGLSVEFVDLHHSFGMKFTRHGKHYAIMGDSSLHADLIKALQEVALGIFDAGHLSDEEIVELAVQSQATTLICSHQYRELDEQQLNAAAHAKGFKGKLVVAHDLMECTL